MNGMQLTITNILTIIGPYMQLPLIKLSNYATSLNLISTRKHSLNQSSKKKKKKKKKKEKKTD